MKPLNIITCAITSIGLYCTAPAYAEKGDWNWQLVKEQGGSKVYWAPEEIESRGNYVYLPIATNDVDQGTEIEVQFDLVFNCNLVRISHAEVFHVWEGDVKISDDFTKDDFADWSDFTMTYMNTGALHNGTDLKAAAEETCATYHNIEGYVVN